MDPKFIEQKKKEEQKLESEKTKTLKEVVKDETAFKKDMAKFYGVNPGATKDVPLENYVG